VPGKANGNESISQLAIRFFKFNCPQLKLLDQISDAFIVLTRLVACWMLSHCFLGPDNNGRSAVGAARPRTARD